ncbi:hypothetical protein B0H13DRAFT_2321717 [Mycena leptocephala]|nr:hypothetical protein B0H13DRAFT_2321717 [Mycena leptocephala]
MPVAALPTQVDAGPPAAMPLLLPQILRAGEPARPSPPRLQPAHNFLLHPHAAETSRAPTFPPARRSWFQLAFTPGSPMRGPPSALNKINISSDTTPSSAQSPVAAVLPNYAPIVSNYLIGSRLNFFFFGTLLLQVYVYRVCFPRDSLGVEFLVCFIFLTMTACTILNAADVEFWLGGGFGDIAGFAEPYHSLVYTPTLGSFRAMHLQLFFCFRIVAIKTPAGPLSVLVGLSGTWSAPMASTTGYTSSSCGWGLSAALAAVLIPLTVTCLLANTLYLSLKTVAIVCTSGKNLGAVAPRLDMLAKVCSSGSGGWELGSAMMLG